MESNFQNKFCKFFLSYYFLCCLHRFTQCTTVAYPGGAKETNHLQKIFIFLVQTSSAYTGLLQWTTFLTGPDTPKK